MATMTIITTDDDGSNWQSTTVEGLEKGDAITAATVALAFYKAAAHLQNAGQPDEAGRYSRTAARIGDAASKVR